MTGQEVYDTLVRQGIVPVIRTDETRDAHLVVEALVEGGIRIAEITMTTPGAIGIIADLARVYGDGITVGAGTVTDLEGCLEAIDAGSRFIVTPTLNEEIVNTCVGKGICVIGGGLTPTEILENWNAGATAVKVFPASVFGPRYLALLHEPFPHIPLVPTGGISLPNVPDYLRAGAAFLGAGGDLVPKASIREKRFQDIVDRAMLYVSAVQAAREQVASP